MVLQCRRTVGSNTQPIFLHFSSISSQARPVAIASIASTAAAACIAKDMLRSPQCVGDGLQAVPTGSGCGEEQVVGLRIEVEDSDYVTCVMHRNKGKGKK